MVESVRPLDPGDTAADMPVIPAYATSAPPAVSKEASGGVLCQTCHAGSLVKRIKYRMSGIVVTIGYLLLIPSILGVLVCILAVVFAGGAGAAASQATFKEGPKQRMVAAGVPQATIDQVLADPAPTPDAIQSLAANLPLSRLRQCERPI